MYDPMRHKLFYGDDVLDEISKRLQEIIFALYASTLSRIIIPNEDKHFHNQLLYLNHQYLLNKLWIILYRQN